jgi:hypothetical protein
MSKDDVRRPPRVRSPGDHQLAIQILHDLLSDGSEDFDYTTPFLREAFDRGRYDMLERMLRGLFVHRLGRQLTVPEQQALSARVRTDDPFEVQDRALDLEGDALAAWLLDPSAK